MKMKTITIHSGQNILDICLQEYGSVEALMQLARDNNMSIDAELQAGQELLIDENNIVDKQVAALFARDNIKINTGEYSDPTQTQPRIFDDTFDTTFE